MKNVINNRLCPACHSGDIQAINAGSSYVHINLLNKMWTEERENGWLPTMLTKHKKKNTEYLKRM